MFCFLKPNKLAGRLCVAMKGMAMLLALMLCLGGNGLTVFAQETEILPYEVIVPIEPSTGVTTSTEASAAANAEESYRYVVNVEFGSMSFYYDWGLWNADTLAYVSDSTSSAPAASTGQGTPGWYGFDGTSNRIGINYRRIGNEAGTEYLKVSLHFDFARDELGNERFAHDHIAFSFYDTADFNGVVAQMNPMNNYSAALWLAPSVDDFSTPGIDEAELMQDYYLSIDGAPYRADATPYKDSTPTSLGLLTIRIEFTSQP